MKLGKLIESINGKAPEARPSLPECEVDTFVIDSREVKAGDVFFALSQPEYANNGFNGDFDDATAFVRTAFEAGAVACVVRHDRFEEHIEELAEFRDRLRRAARFSGTSRILIMGLVIRLRFCDWQRSLTLMLPFSKWVCPRRCMR